MESCRTICPSYIGPQLILLCCMEDQSLDLSVLADLKKMKPQVLKCGNVGGHTTHIFSCNETHNFYPLRDALHVADTLTLTGISRVGGHCLCKVSFSHIALPLVQPRGNLTLTHIQKAFAWWTVAARWLTHQVPLAAHQSHSITYSPEFAVGELVSHCMGTLLPICLAAFRPQLLRQSVKNTLAHTMGTPSICILLYRCCYSHKGV